MISSPTYPAVIFLYGFTFVLALAHFLAVPWSRMITITFYVLLLVWVLALTWRKRSWLLPLTPIDVLFMGFVLLVLGSLVFQGGLQSGAVKFAVYLPFMVIAPYLCGRMMRTQDLEILLRAVMYAGLAMLPLLLLDRMVSPDLEEGARWTFFGQNHAALLVGALLAGSLLAICARGTLFINLGGNLKSRLFHYGVIGVMTGFLVWVQARGWLVAAIVGLVVLILSAYRDKTLRGVYARQLVFVVAVVSLSLMILPRSIGEFYAMLLTEPPQLTVSTPPQLTVSTPPQLTVSTPPQLTVSTGMAGPILGEESCRPFEEGVNSVAMRWVLYREAVAMFAAHPIGGVGAGMFGARSCVGLPWYPHSTVLQALSELGIVGGGLLLGLFFLAARTFAYKCVVAKPYSPAHAFALSLFSAYFVIDQFYGNYFMSVGTFLIIGVAAGMLADEKRGKLNR